MDTNDSPNPTSTPTPYLVRPDYEATRREYRRESREAPSRIRVLATSAAVAGVMMTAGLGLLTVSTNHAAATGIAQTAPGAQTTGQTTTTNGGTVPGVAGAQAPAGAPARTGHASTGGS